MEFKDILQKLIDKKDVNPYRIGEDTAVSKQQIMSYAKGATKPAMDQILELSRYFDVSIDFLLTGRDCQEVTDLLRENRELRIELDNLKKSQSPQLGGTSDASTAQEEAV